MLVYARRTTMKIEIEFCLQNLQLYVFCIFMVSQNEPVSGTFCPLEIPMEKWKCLLTHARNTNRNTNRKVEIFAHPGRCKWWRLLNCFLKCTTPPEANLKLSHIVKHWDKLQRRAPLCRGFRKRTLKCILHEWAFTGCCTTVSVSLW